MQNSFDGSLVRAEIIQTFDQLLTGLREHDEAAVRQTLADDAHAVTSHLGELDGGGIIAAALAEALPAADVVRLRATNRQVAATVDDHVVQSAYLTGVIARDRPTDELDALLFGGHLALEYRKQAEQWHITELRLQLDWRHGDAGQVPGWHLPDGRAGWHEAWRQPAVVAELDSPWRRLGVGSTLGDDDEQVRSAYTRYTWGLDQADFALMATTFTEDIEADMSPFGLMSSRRTVVASLKALRNGQPYMQHSAPVMLVDRNGDEARMTIYRAVPFAPTTQSLDAPIYGAYYDSSLRREDGLWKFSALRYIPGWIEGPAAQ